MVHILTPMDLPNSFGNLGMKLTLNAPWRLPSTVESVLDAGFLVSVPILRNPGFVLHRNCFIETHNLAGFETSL
jgi:hypothetical protein